MDNREKILKLLRSRQKSTAPALAKELGISRQKVTKHLSRLVKEGLVTKEGSTRNSIYSLAGHKKPIPTLSKLKLVKKLKDLKEDVVYSEIEGRLHLNKLAEGAQTITFYSFSEMLNNAIDHSKSKNTVIEVEMDSENFKFTIKDLGIGIFANVRNKFHLANEFEALEHVLKGKQTTFPEQHSGQGIFFTSKIADIFKIRSHKIEVTKDNISDDLFVKDARFVKGTEVSFQIKKRTRKILRDLFNQYSNEDYQFDKTEVKINLTADKELLARSQAKRILLGLEAYKMIILDFKKVREIGQAFVDEIFRVYCAMHPQIQIKYINANPAVEHMIKRGLKPI